MAKEIEEMATNAAKRDRPTTCMPLSSKVATAAARRIASRLAQASHGATRT